MSFTVLPDVLKDLIVGFAYKITNKQMQHDFDTIDVFRSWDLDPMFLQRRVWIRDDWCFRNNPLLNYIPLKLLQTNFDLFDMLRVYEMLDRLDFRKRDVRCMGTRESWFLGLDRIEVVGLFSMFYKYTANNPDNLKPVFRGKPMLF